MTKELSSDSQKYKYGGKRTWEIVFEAVRTFERPVTPAEVKGHIASVIPNFALANVGADLAAISVNSTSRGHYGPMNGKPRRTDSGNEHDRLIQVGSGRSVRFTVYNPNVHGVWALVDTGEKVLRPKFLHGADSEEPESARASAASEGTLNTSRDSRPPIVAAIAPRNGQTAVTPTFQALADSNAFGERVSMFAQEGLTASDYSLLLEKCRALPFPSGDYGDPKGFMSILMLTVLDYQLHNTVVDRAHSHFEKHHGELKSITSLAACLSMFPDTQEGNTAAALDLWGYKHWTRLAQLRVLVAYFQSIGIVDLDALRVWATKADFNRDFRGRVKGLGPAVFQWLVMRAGVETVKPDVHVMSFVFSAIGYKPSFDTVISSLETIARSLGRRPRELDLSIWETQRGGPGRV
jgi:hypothetical protein